MSWEELRRQHLQLSEAAAINYDETYSIGNFATNIYMDFEIRLINKLALRAPDRNLAVDLGCGTGRYSYVLAEQFNQVYAYDFSPKMIEVANANKIRRRVDNIFFAVRDVEREPLNLQAGSASFVISTFGMGSFVEDIEALFQRVSSMLKPQGVAIFSFYISSY
jgi:SAM-dependent methyltransferase